MKFEPYSYFGGTPKKVTGTVTSSQDKVEWVLTGTWDAKLEGSRVIGNNFPINNFAKRVFTIAIDSFACSSIKVFYALFFYVLDVFQF